MKLSEEKITDYIEQYSSQEDDILNEIHRETYLKQVYPGMLSGQIQGKFLEFLSAMLKPGRVLEIGTFTAYSTVCLARGLGQNGKLITIEKNIELEEIIRKSLEKAALNHSVEPLFGNAAILIPQIDELFDLVFIDADKENYPLYLKLVLPKLKAGGFIFADNVLWGGKVVETSVKADKETKGIIEFNKLVFESPQLENVILPIRDGISIIRKKY